MAIFDNSGFGGGLLALLNSLGPSSAHAAYAPIPGPVPMAPLPVAPTNSFAERFNALPNAPQPFQPSGRTFDRETFSASNYEPNAQPIAVGDYMMPRFGPASLFQPQQSQGDTAVPTNAQPAMGQMPQQTQQTLPSFLGGSQSDNPFLNGLQGFLGNLHNGPVGALAGGIGALATGKRTDPSGIAQQNLRAQYEALVPMVGPQKAMLAIMNPEAGKTILEQALSSKQKFTEIGVGSDGTKQYGFVNDRDQTVKPYAAPGSSSPATITGPDGKQIAIPPGVDRKTFVNEVSRANAKAAAGEKTEVQAKSEKFGNKMETAEATLGRLDTQGTSPGNRVLESLPGGNYGQNENYQKYKQARDNFITALLRDESGAAIGTQEFNRYERELFPQPGDSQAVIEQKRTARKVAIEAMKKSAGPGYKSPELPETAPAQQIPTLQSGQSHTIGNVTIKRL